MDPREKTGALLTAFGWALGYLLAGKAAALLVLPTSAAAAFMHHCVAAPLAEELMFRGVVQRALAPLGSSRAVWIQAALFALQHRGAASMVYALCMGAVLGWLREKTGSVLPGMAVHTLNNLLVFAAG